MNWYKIAQTSEFYTWFSNEILRLTDNYKHPLPTNMNSPQMLSEVAEGFGDLTANELKKININDLYVLNYIKHGTLGKGIKTIPRSMSERISGVSKEWMDKALKTFPEILVKYIIPYISKEVIEHPIPNWYNISNTIGPLIPKETKEKVLKVFENSLRNKTISFPEVPIDLVNELSPELKKYIINTYADSFKNASNLEIVPKCIRDDVQKAIQKLKKNV